jgi:bifunctional N-acetylglucosamine-1-phosphate-uridyltransferase/glucosamine-1-phosphate-acetyltransferase GlmU-like protein
MSRLLIIPAAGIGSRLGADVPKVLVRVAGMTMLERLLNLYRASASHVALIINPASEDLVRQHVKGLVDAERISCVPQPQPTGMLDAILLGRAVARRVEPSSVWVTWCDQIAAHRRTIERLGERTLSASQDAMVMPTVMQTKPYIHLERDSNGRIIRVLHQREGDAMPPIGESDMGLFALSATTYFNQLTAYAQEVEVGRATGERNFLPFIPWLARTETVTTFPAEDPMEAVGINTPQDLALVEQYLRSVSAPGASSREPEANNSKP